RRAPAGPRLGREPDHHQLLPATGAGIRRLPVPGAELPGIYYLRTVADGDAVKRQAVAGRRAVVVGMGLLGGEGAASLTQLGSGSPRSFPPRDPLERVLGTRLGALVGRVHRANGVRLPARSEER